MRNMSFALTTEAVRAQKKTVTRRTGWKTLKPGTLIQPVVKGMGLKKGERVEKIGPPIRVLKVDRVVLGDISPQDVYREGFPEMTARQFVQMFKQHNGGLRDQVVTRIEFEYVKRYPLEWPLGWKRTRPSARRPGRFKNEGKWITVVAATARLERECERLKARNTVLSTNVSLRLDGRPRSDEKPSDPGAAIYFSFRGKATVLACDTYTEVSDNIAALAAHLDALRAIERYGVGTIEQALAGYKALPADSAADWRAVFGFASDARPTPDQVDQKYKEWAKQKHPDLGGTDVEMAHLNRARDYALMELQS